MATEPKHPSILDTCRAHSTGNPTFPLALDYQQQTPLTDEAGRLWNRLHVNGDAVSFINPLPTFAFVVGNPTVRIDSGSFANFGASETGSQGSGYLLKFIAKNLTATPYFFQFHDLVGPLAGGEIPYILYDLPANATLTDAWLPGGNFFGQGITWAISTTAASYTAVGSNDAYVGFTKY